MNHRVHILTGGTIGLYNDGVTLANALGGDKYKSKIFQPRRRNMENGLGCSVARARQILPFGRGAFANLHCEKIRHRWMPAALRNYLVPNQEWFWEENDPVTRKIDAVLCKTRIAEKVFSENGFRTHFIGFASKDRYRSTVTKNFDKFLHAAGKSMAKGTRTLSEVWSRHPEWPELTIITTHPEMVTGKDQPNIKVLTEMISEDELIELQNSSGVHMCPSEVEGFGHYIGEALSCGAIVVTTDAAPMNELVTPDIGFAATYGQTFEKSFGNRYLIDPGALENVIQKVVDLQDSEKAALSKATRQAYLQKRDEFYGRLRAFFDQEAAEYL